MATRTVDLGNVIGPQGPQGPQGAKGATGATGPAGPAGASAFAQAVAAGYTGTEAQFYAALVSLKNAPFLPLTGGTLTGNLRIDSDDTGTVHKINLGDGEYVYFAEPEDDYLEIHAKSIRFTGQGTASSNPLALLQGGTGRTDGLSASQLRAGTFPVAGVCAATGTDYTAQRVRNIAFKDSDPGAGSSLSSGNILFVYE